MWCQFGTDNLIGKTELRGYTQKHTALKSWVTLAVSMQITRNQKVLLWKRFSVSEQFIWTSRFCRVSGNNSKSNKYLKGKATTAVKLLGNNKGSSVAGSGQEDTSWPRTVTHESLLKELIHLIFPKTSGH